ncbi:MAG TPA: hypothetical protein VG711_02315 [Phycisphaerales bacterium]|nr:hypothetical protein [Phycisphaerales bacterium]
MSCITRGIIRWGLIGGLGLAGVTMLVGPERVSACLAQIRMKAQGVVDRCVDDPIALRRQLEELSNEYPDRIAKVRGELAEVQHQIDEFSRDSQISQRVVAMTTNDLEQLKTLVAKAETTAQSSTRPVAIEFSGSKFDVDEAYTEARRISTVRGTYTDRAASDAQQLKFLTEQKGRLNEILTKLDTEYQTFQAKMWQLDRQIDAIDRNDRLIDLMKEHQATLANYEKFGKVGNLKQLESKLAEMRGIQEAQLQTMEKSGLHTDYEGKAETQLNMESVSDNPFDDLDQPVAPAAGDEQQAPAQPTSAKIALLEPIVIR